MFSCRFPSFHDFVQHRASSLRKWLGGHKLPCAAEFAFASERIDPAGLRDCMGEVYARHKRNKILTPLHGWMLGAVDGHEINSSYKRCCEQCCQRKIKVGGVERVQYYHRVVVFQLISKGVHFLFDLETVLPGDDEVAAALRLLQRVLERYPRCCDVVTADAIYLRPSVIEALAAHGKHLVVVVKENQRELLQEARTLLAAEPSNQFTLPDRAGQSQREVTLWQADGFTTESITTPLRIVQAHESGVQRELIAKKWHEQSYETTWFWATTMPQSLAPGRAIFDFGHDRWRIENEGFNELVRSWHSSHVFHHHHVSMQVLWLMLFMAHAVFHCFHDRNLKPEQRARHTVIYFAEQMAAAYRLGAWLPPSPG